MRRGVMIIVAVALALTADAANAKEPDILLVSDAGTEDLEGYYGPLCLEAGRTYQAWNVSRQGTVAPEILGTFATVVWVTGNNAWPQGVSDASEKLREYVDAGGHLVVIGDHVASCVKKLLADRFGLEVRWFNPRLKRLSGRLSDCIAQGWSLDLSTPGAEMAEYARGDHGECGHEADIVFWAPDCGVSRLTAARVEKRGRRGFRAAWFGIDLQRVTDAERAREVFLRTIRWTSPEPCLQPRERAFEQLWAGQ